MTDLPNQIEKIEKEIRETPYHKATEHHIGKLRAKLARLKDRVEERESRRAGGGKGGYAVKKQGDATVVLLGPPSVGKSTLLNKLTNAKSKIAPYEFTTVSVIPGMMEHKDAKIQILDVPGLIEGAEKGRGRGREVLSVARGADLLLILCDVGREKVIPVVISVLEKTGIRINQEPPSVGLEKKADGGIVIHSSISQSLGKETIKEVARESGIKNAEINIREKLTMDRLIDAFSKSRVYVPAIFVINKSDLIKNKPKYMKKVTGVNLFHPTVFHPTGEVVPTRVTFPLVSAEKGMGLDKLREEIWNKLQFVRIYLVRPGENPSHDHPIIMKKGTTLYDVAQKIGEQFAEGKTRAKIWGETAKYPGQEVSLKIPVSEGMQVRFI